MEHRKSIGQTIDRSMGERKGEAGEGKSGAFPKGTITTAAAAAITMVFGVLFLRTTKSFWY